MIEIVSKIPLVMPEYKLDAKALTDLGKALEGSVLGNIKNQEQADGSRLKPNPPGYARQKRAAGWGSRSLVAGEHSLVKGQGKSFTYSYNVASSTVTLRPTPGDAAERSEHVQERGYTGWLGIGERAVAAMKQVMFDFIARATKNAARKRRPRG